MPADKNGKISVNRKKNEAVLCEIGYLYQEALNDEMDQILEEYKDVEMLDFNEERFERFFRGNDREQKKSSASRILSVMELELQLSLQYFYLLGQR